MVALAHKWPTTSWSDTARRIVARPSTRTYLWHRAHKAQGHRRAMNPPDRDYDTLPPMKIDIRIDSITTNRDETIKIRRTGVTCLVGSNNVGKSQILRNIAERIRSYTPFTYEFAIVKDLALTVDNGLSDVELEIWLTKRGLKHLDAAPGQPAYMLPNSQHERVSISDWRQWFDNSLGQGLQNLSDMFMWHASPGILAHTISGGIGDPMMDPATYRPNNPSMEIFRSGDLEEQLSNIAFEAFGERLTLDRVTSDRRLRIGEPDPTVPVPPINRPNPTYAAAVGALPKLESQGDGIRSYLGLVAHVLAGGSQILLIDEPDTFLHPAQSRNLGRWLARKAAELDLQVVVATHDRDFILGLLSTDTEDVDVIRVARNEQTNTLSRLTADRITQIWQDPFLRYSNTLQGLFHKRVVVCEGDGDCRFYSATLDHIAEHDEMRPIANDTLFVPCGGKDKAPIVLRALSELGVQATAILDFDALNNKSLLKKLLEAVGEVWTTEMEDCYTTVIRYINAQPGDHSNRWKLFKRTGVSALPSGDIFSACTTLVSYLSGAGLVILLEGELESADRSISAHGSTWVSQALLEDVHRKSEVAANIVKRAIMHS